MRAVESKLQAWRRSAVAKALEAELIDKLVNGAKRGVNGARLVTQRKVEAVRDGEEWARAGGVFKRMQLALTSASSTLTAGDWLWEVVRSAQQQEQISCDAARGQRGVKGLQQEGWRESLRQDRSGRWETFKRSVVAALRKAGSAGEMRKSDYRVVMQTVKRRAPGRAAASLKVVLWDLAATEGLVVEGQGVDGVVSGDWKKESWWQSALDTLRPQLTGEELQRLEELGVRVRGWSWAESRPSTGRSCLVHWFSGWGSGVGEAAVAAGLEVISVELDAGRLLVSGGTPVQLDVGSVAPRWLLPEVAWRAGVSRVDLLAHWGGPPCQTVAVPDASNRRMCNATQELQEFNFRVHTEGGSRPPAHPEGNWRGDAAVVGDKLSRALLLALRGEECWAIENPLGYLRYRPWYQGLEAEGLLQRVDYCAYWSREEAAGELGFQKQSCVWTAVQWRPCGSTGEGVCGGACEVGWNEEGQWRHHPLQGHSRRDKCRVPAALVREWLRAAGW